MSLLALDISNSHTTFGIFEGDKLTAHWRVKSDEHRTSDEWYLVLQGLITRVEAWHIMNWLQVHIDEIVSRHFDCLRDAAAEPAA